MEKIMYIRNSNRTGEILDYIHDLWIDLDHVEYEKVKRQLLILILIEEWHKKGALLSRRKKFYKEKYLLVLHNVITYQIEDTEMVRYYDINTIAYNNQRNLLTIKTGIPLIFEVIVSDFEITLWSPSLSLAPGMTENPD